MICNFQMFSFIGCSDKYLKTSRVLWQYRKDDLNDALMDSQAKFESKIIGRPAGNFKIKDVNLSKLATLEMPLMNCEVKFTLTWQKNCVVSSVAGPKASELYNFNLDFLH